MKGFLTLPFINQKEGKMSQKLDQKIVMGYERIAEAFKVMLWEKAKSHQLSPIQIQLLIYIADHRREDTTVSHLAKAFNLTKPTVSDAVRVLLKKEWLEKDFSGADKRSYTLFLTPVGSDLVLQLKQYSSPLEVILKGINSQSKEEMYQHLTSLIYQFNQKGILQVQRTCKACRFFQEKGEGPYCNFIQKHLKVADFQLDCDDFQAF